MSVKTLCEVRRSRFPLLSHRQWRFLPAVTQKHNLSWSDTSSWTQEMSDPEAPSTSTVDEQNSSEAQRSCLSPTSRRPQGRFVHCRSVSRLVFPVSCASLSTSGPISEPPLSPWSGGGLLRAICVSRPPSLSWSKHAGVWLRMAAHLLGSRLNPQQGNKYKQIHD